MKTKTYKRKDLALRRDPFGVILAVATLLKWQFKGGGKRVQPGDRPMLCRLVRPLECGSHRGQIGGVEREVGTAEFWTLELREMVHWGSRSDGINLGPFVITRACGSAYEGDIGDYTLITNEDPWKLVKVEED